MFDTEECFLLVVQKTCHKWTSSNVKASILKLACYICYQTINNHEPQKASVYQSTCTKQWNDTRHWGRQDCSAAISLHVQSSGMTLDTEDGRTAVLTCYTWQWKTKYSEAGYMT